MRVAVNPVLIRWARERAGYTQKELTKRFAKLSDWESGNTKPTLNQAKAFACAVYVPVGYLFMTEPPDESIPLQDFRAFSEHSVNQPSPNLLDTLYMCQERQEWFQEYARGSGCPELNFVGSAAVEASPENAAEEIRKTLKFDISDRSECQTWIDANWLLIQQAEELGILVMVSGVVQNNNHRILDPAEFRSFAISDLLAPLIFINGRDTKAAQMFTLAHEIAHIWLGVSAISNHSAFPGSNYRREEMWCNAVAAEILVPLNNLKTKLQTNESLPNTLSRLARIFKVSTLVILRRLLDIEWISRNIFNDEWDAEVKCLANFVLSDKSQGNFYNTTLSRVGRRFAYALVVDTLEGQTLYRDAYRMLGLPKTQTFDKLARELGVIV